MNLWNRLIQNMLSPLFRVTIVNTTILYWTNITLSKMADFDKWVRKPETKARLASAKKNCVGTIHKTVH